MAVRKCLSIESISASIRKRGPRPRMVQPPQVPGVPSGQAQRPETPQLLSRNYRISFSGKQGDKQLGTLTALTCSPMITLTGTLEQAEIPTLISVSGRLEEQEGRESAFIGRTVPPGGLVLMPGERTSPEPGSR